MKQIASLIASIALGVAAPFAMASPDVADTQQPKIGGAEVIYVSADNSGINSNAGGSEFWYAGTSGVASD